MKPLFDSDLETSLNQISPTLPTALRDQMLFAAGQQAALHSTEQRHYRQLGGTALASCLLCCSIAWFAWPETADSAPDSLVVDIKQEQLVDNEFASQTLSTRSTLTKLWDEDIEMQERVYPVSGQNSLTTRSSIDL
jgi:hypothetical protein